MATPTTNMASRCPHHQDGRYQTTTPDDDKVDDDDDDDDDDDMKTPDNNDEGRSRSYLKSWNTM
jgi:hypothetical protein